MDRFKGLSGRHCPEHFAWTNEPPNWHFAGDQLQFSVPAGSDYFRDPVGAAPVASAPFLSTAVSGDFTVVTRADADMKAEYDSACLMIYADPTRWAKLCYEFSYGWPSLVSVVTDEVSDDCNSLLTLASPPYLRLSRRGDTVAMHYSVNEKTWYLIRYFRLTLPQEIRVGVVGQSPAGQGCNVWFNGFSLSDQVVADFRSGL